MLRGKFISFEGGEGSGKSTQSKLLCEWLGTFQIHTLWTREPGGTPAAEIIRHILLSGSARPFGAEMETLLFYAARMDHVSTKILPELNKRNWVICDRFADSTKAYQMAASGVKRSFLNQVEAVCLEGFKPDLTFVFDIDPAIALDRVGKRNEQQNSSIEKGTGADRFESEDVQFHQKVREEFRDIAMKDSKRCCLVDANQPIDVIQLEIQNIVKDRFVDAFRDVEVENG